MNSTVKFTLNTVLVTVALYAVVAGLFVIAGVLGWSAWDEIGSWLGKIAAIAGIFVVFSAIVAGVTSLFRRG